MARKPLRTLEEETSENNNGKPLNNALGNENSCLTVIVPGIRVERLVWYPQLLVQMIKPEKEYKAHLYRQENTEPNEKGNNNYKTHQRNK